MWCAGIKELDIQVGGRPVGWSPYPKENKDVRRRIFGRSRLGRPWVWRTGLWRPGVWRTWIRWSRLGRTGWTRPWRPGFRGALGPTRTWRASQAIGGRYGRPAARWTGERRAERAACFWGDRRWVRAAARDRRTCDREVGRSWLRERRRRGGNPDRAGPKCVAVEGHQQREHPRAAGSGRQIQGCRQDSLGTLRTRRAGADHPLVGHRRPEGEARRSAGESADGDHRGEAVAARRTR